MHILQLPLCTKIVSSINVVIFQTSAMHMMNNSAHVECIHFTLNKIKYYFECTQSMRVVENIVFVFVPPIFPLFNYSSNSHEFQIVQIVSIFMKWKYILVKMSIVYQNTHCEFYFSMRDRNNIRFHKKALHPNWIQRNALWITRETHK